MFSIDLLFALKCFVPLLHTATLSLSKSAGFMNTRIVLCSSSDGTIRLKNDVVISFRLSTLRLDGWQDSNLWRSKQSFSLK